MWPVTYTLVYACRYMTCTIIYECRPIFAAEAFVSLLPSTASITECPVKCLEFPFLFLKVTDTVLGL